LQGFQPQGPPTRAKTHFVRAAEQLFAQKGYNAVTLRDIAAEIGIHHTSLYHHAPGGKEKLFIEVTERNLTRHREGLLQSIHQAKPDVRSRLRAVAAWLVSQPPMNLLRMTHADMPSISPAQAYRLSELAYETMIVPLEQMLQQAQHYGEIEHHDLVVCQC
jgi:AcrR family transcriptional regulator